MAGIRGVRSAMPKKGKKPTGMFSSKGQQKQDGASGPNMDTFKYAHRNSNDKNGTKAGGLPSDGAGKRHQKPRTDGKVAGRVGTPRSIKL
jgi:hypothetical protein